MAQSEFVAVPSDKKQLHSWSQIRFVIGLRVCFWLANSTWFYENLHLMSAPPGRAGFFTSIFHLTRFATVLSILDCPRMPHSLRRRRSRASTMVAANHRNHNR